MKNFIVKGNFCYSKNIDELITKENCYAVCVDSICQGIFEHIPKDFEALPVLDYTDKLIIPGLVDLHLHAPQFAFRGMNMDMELLQWLDTNAFCEEAKYSDLDYAKKAYSIFADCIKNSATTRACIFATIHNKSTELLMDMMENSGLVSFVGKVNMDRNSIKSLCEESAQISALDTESFIADTLDKYENTKPIITPRFVPSCSDELLKKLGELQKKYAVPVQSHLSENLDEIQWVKELCPDSKSYADAYDRFSLFGNGAKTIMAHCVHLNDDEIELIKKNEVFVAHCPASNINLRSGISPVRKLMDNGLKIGLGSDVAGGETISMFSTIVQTIKSSKLYQRLVNSSFSALTFENAFYLATKGGGEFFGKVGSFEKGYEFDAVIIDDSVLPHPQELNIRQRVERSVYLSADLLSINAKFVKGKKII